jgi:hypothetical protein
LPSSSATTSSSTARDTQEIWRELKKTREGQHVCSYDSFKRNYVYVLKKLGLIEEASREPLTRRGNAQSG